MRRLRLQPTSGLDTPGPATAHIAKTLKNTGKSNILTFPALFAGAIFRFLLTADQTQVPESIAVATCLRRRVTLSSTHFAIGFAFFGSVTLISRSVGDGLGARHQCRPGASTS